MRSGRVRSRRHSMTTTNQLPALSLSLAGCAPPIGSGPLKVRFAAGDPHIVGNLYLPADAFPGARHPAIVVGGSLTSVKEQMSAAYARAMAERGFVALAIDYRHYGESGGEPRQYEN